MRVYTFSQNEELLELRVDKKISDSHSVIGHGGDFLILQTLDQMELKFYHVSSKFLMPQTIKFDDGLKMSFALSKAMGSAN